MRLNNGLKRSLTVMLKKKRNIPIYSFDGGHVFNLYRIKRSRFIADFFNLNLGVSETDRNFKWLLVVYITNKWHRLM